MRVVIKVERFLKGYLAHQISNKFVWCVLGYFVLKTELPLYYHFLIMMTLNGLNSFMLIYFYDKKRIDWVFLESFKSSISKSEKFEHKHNTFTKTIGFLIKKGKIFLILWDSTVTALFLRKFNHRYDGFKDRNVIIYYLLSVLLSSIIPFSAIVKFYK